MAKQEARRAEAIQKQAKRYREERDAEIRRRVAAGETLERVAVDYLLSRERVRQIASGTR